MTRTPEETRRLFDEWAKSYDADLEHETGPLIGYQQSMKLIGNAFPVFDGMHILDIGIGSGTVAEKFAQQGASIMGIDVSSEMLAVCAEKHPAFQLALGSFEEIPAQDQAFDAIVSGFAFHETPISERLNACREMARVLKVDGYLSLLDIMFLNDPAQAEARNMTLKHWDDSEDYARVAELDELLRKTGFTSVKWTQTSPFHWMVTARLTVR